MDKLEVDPGCDPTWWPGTNLRSTGMRVFRKSQRFVTAIGQPVTRDVGIAE
jgi:hypothetical protein